MIKWLTSRLVVDIARQCLTAEPFLILFDQVAEWHKANMPDETLPQTCAHLREEAKELSSEPDSLEEAADVLLTLCEVVSRNGYTARSLLAAASIKQTRNEHRHWAKSSKGYYKHVDREAL